MKYLVIYGEQEKRWRVFDANGVLLAKDAGAKLNAEAAIADAKRRLGVGQWKVFIC